MNKQDQNDFNKFMNTINNQKKILKRNNLKIDSLEVLKKQLDQQSKHFQQHINSYIWTQNIINRRLNNEQ